MKQKNGILAIKEGYLNKLLGFELSSFQFQLKPL